MTLDCHPDSNHESPIETFGLDRATGAPRRHTENDVTCERARPASAHHAFLQVQAEVSGHQHGVDHVNHAIGLHDIADRDVRDIALVVGDG